MLLSELSARYAVFCGTWNKYNRGCALDGEFLWLNDYDNFADFLEVCGRLHSDEHAPEFAFLDTDADGTGCEPSLFFGGEGCPELDTIKTIYKIAGIANNEDEFYIMLDDWHKTGEVAETAPDYMAVCDGEQDYNNFLDRLADDMMTMEGVGEKSNLRYYFDYDAWRRDCEISAETRELANGKIAVISI